MNWLEQNISTWDSNSKGTLHIYITIVVQILSKKIVITMDPTSTVICFVVWPHFLILTIYLVKMIILMALLGGQSTNLWVGRSCKRTGSHHRHHHHHVRVEWISTKTIFMCSQCIVLRKEQNNIKLITCWSISKSRYDSCLYDAKKLSILNHNILTK